MLCELENALTRLDSDEILLAATLNLVLVLELELELDEPAALLELLELELEELELAELVELLDEFCAILYIV